MRQENRPPADEAVTGDGPGPVTGTDAEPGAAGDARAAGDTGTTAAPGAGRDTGTTVAPGAAGDTDQPPRLAPRPLRRPPVDPVAALQFGRPDTVVGGFEPLGNGAAPH